MNCCAVPLAIEGLAGVTAIDTSAAGVTVTTAELLVTMPDTALTVVDPVVSDVPNPVALIVATAEIDELHVAELVRFCVLLSV